MYFTLFVMLVTAQAEASPTVESKVFHMDSQWRAIEASPRIVDRTREGGTGSSVIVGVKDGFAYALTAAHVVRDSSKLDAEFFLRDRSGSSHTVTGVLVLAKNPAADLALLQIPLGPATPKPPVLKLAEPGNRPKHYPVPVLSVGCDDGFSARCHEDQLLAKRFVRRPEKRVAFFWETRNASVHGRSGGPLLDQDLKVIGICAANRNDRGYFGHIDEIHAWLKKEYSWLWTQK